MIRGLLGAGRALIGNPVLLLAVVALVFSAVAFGYVRGYSSAEARCRVEALEQEKANLQRDLHAAEQAAAEAERIAQEEAERSATLVERINAFEAELATRPDIACELSDDDVGRLRELAGTGAGN